MNITLTGSSGFLGTRLVARLLQDGHKLHVLGRKRSASLPASVLFSAWDALAGPPPGESVAEADAVINLAGEPVSQRWTDEVKRRIVDSRRLGTKHLVQALADSQKKPAVLVSASAIGYYGNRGDEILVETSEPGLGYLPQICVEWERQALSAIPLGIRVALVRIGVVLGQDGGALAQMLTPFKLGAGGRLGDGRQWMSWIHVEDMIEMFLFAIKDDAVRGAINGVSPSPIRNVDFTAALAAAVHRPAMFPVPKIALKLMFGEMAEIVLGSLRVVPKAAQNAGFTFRHPELGPALENLLQ